ncbi:glucose-6-phosphate dehydrogenase assembly protein OpcA [Bifidobacterium vansinderenii]|uniref:OpcA protein n=1 Tax=Bifidobacterium vansinderenii TaxID=1984871 RepID=A0A229VW47_9BIFI|nr:glucose-6-phosphate dehydrogenase assembly protein OpcA [Bifidobacterium vansinderenii]OXM99755.1 OpcA protein [Bifidobacterium vansinderenii]
MIVELPNSTTAEISRRIDQLHKERGESAQSRVLTLLISTDEDHLEDVVETANTASREHPCRVIALVAHPEISESRLDAQVRFGADAGAGEVIVLRPTNGLTRHLDTLVIPLLVPDSPIVAWWPGKAPENLAEDPIGRMATSRVTDAMESPNPEALFTALRANWSPRDTDMSWTSLTVWRGVLASMLDQPPYLPVESVVVRGGNRLCVDLVASWLAVALKAPTRIERTEQDTLIGVYFHREDGVTSLERGEDTTAIISQPGQAEQRISLPRRSMVECLSEELRRLDPDEEYAEVITHGWKMVDHY